jgi:HK97 family phage major capsid protein
MAEHEDQLRARLAQVKAEIVAIDEQYIDQYIDPKSDDGEKYNTLNAEHDELKKVIAQRDARRARIAEISGSADAVAESTYGHSGQFNIGSPMTEKDLYDLSTIRASVANPQQMRGEMHDRARRAVDRMVFPHDKADQAKCKENIERILATSDDEHGNIARRVLVTSAPAYKSAFGKWIATGGNQFSADMQLGTGSEGGYAVPVELDPTLLPTSNSVVNPYRAVSRIVQTTAKQWQAVTAGAVVATRQNEVNEETDASPTLAQPVVSTERVSTFIPFSVSLEASWAGMQGDLARLIQDSKDVEEVGSFTNGTAVAPSANGLLNGATAVVKTAATATFASADIDTMENALGARFRSEAVIMGNRAIFNKIRHFDAAGGPDYWLAITQALGSQPGSPRIAQPIHGYPSYENTALPSTTTSNTQLLVLGDFGRYFVIVDKIGLNIELVPHLFGSSNRYPTGERGFWAYWFNNCQVLSPAAFITLEAL